MITFFNDTKTFKLDTPDSTYAFCITADGHLLHLYYGAYVPDSDLSFCSGYGNTFIASTVENEGYILSGFPFEYAPYGTGSFVNSCLRVEDKNGNEACDIIYASHIIYKGRKPLEGLPYAFGTEEDFDTLEVTCVDTLTGLNTVLFYTVFNKLDAICRSTRLINNGADTLKVRAALSAQFQLPYGNYDLISLPGRWAEERQIEREKVRNGKTVMCSTQGKTSHEMNNFITVCESNATEDRGSAYGLCLVYSGSFVAGTDAGCYCELTRPTVFTGINPEGFCWELKSKDSFQTPEAILVYSDEGLGKMSRTYHDVIRRHIIRSKWKNMPRPVLINNWEGTYFNFDEDKLVSIAAKAREAGIDMLVVDDGWFGHRNNDKSSLGDWFTFTEKLPLGMKHLVDRVNSLGMKFGLWFEPEMISPDSELYRAHPDWCLHIDGRVRHTQRNQLVLDFSRKEVRDNIFEQMKKMLNSANIEYVKWDHNRSLSEIGNSIDKNQGSIAHKYMLGVYELLERITAEFPDLLIEGCSGGGARFDAGMLYYTPQIWTSDDSDAIERLMIQKGTSLCYPLLSMGTHVSAIPNHQMGRSTPLETRGIAALPGTFGYELDITNCTDEEMAEIKKQVELYKSVEELVRTGSYYRLVERINNFDAWELISRDGNEVIVEYIKILAHVEGNDVIKLKGLDKAAYYKVDGGKVLSGKYLMAVGLTMNVVRRDFSGKTVRLTRV